MGRRRTTNRHLPHRVYIHHGSYRYEPKAGKRVTLARAGDYSGMLRELARIQDASDRPLDTMGAVFDRYELEIIPAKAESTHADQRRMLDNLRKAFGKMRPGDLKKQHAAQYRDKRAQGTKVRKGAPTAANRELELLSHVCTMADEWGVIDENPLFRLRKVKRQPRERYVTDAEYAHILSLASPMVRCVIDLALLTGLRRGDIFRLTRADITDKGLTVRPSKTGKSSRVRLMFVFTPALEQVIEDALKLEPRARQPIVCNRKGKPYTKNGFDSVWQRLMDRATDPKRKEHIEHFEFRDLRRKSASDEVDELVASQRLGHSSVAITNRVYRVKPKTVRPLR